jgi:hypothetical protein
MTTKNPKRRFSSVFAFLFYKIKLSFGKKFSLWAKETSKSSLWAKESSKSSLLGPKRGKTPKRAPYRALMQP